MANHRITQTIPHNDTIAQKLVSDIRDIGKIQMGSPLMGMPNVVGRLKLATFHKQEAFEKCLAHSPLRAAARHLFYIAIHQVSLLSHPATVACSLRIDVHNNVNA